MIYRFRTFELDTLEASLRRDGELLETQPKVLDALRLFVENSGRLQTREELMAQLWPGVIVGEESLTQVVRKLRHLLGDDPQRPEFLMTVHKRGYRFLPAVEAVAPPTPAAAAPLPELPPDRRDSGVAPRKPDGASESPAALDWREWLGWLGAAALLVIAATFYLQGRGTVPRNSTSRVGEWSVRRLTVTPERENFPALSPDGTRYAFVRAVGPPLLSDLFVADLDGGWTRLTASSVEEFAPQFSPDGRTIVYSIREPDRSSVWSLPVLGGAPTFRVEDAEWGTWSPDGAAIAFVRREPGGRSSVRALDLATGTTRLLWSTDGPASAAAWSPNGHSVAVIGKNQVLVGPASGHGAAQPVGPPFEYVRSLAWEPDSQALLVDGRLPGQQGNLTRLPLDGSPSSALTRGSIDLFHPSLSRDGRRLLYAAEHKVRQIWRFDADRRPLAALALPTAIECFDVAPDGSLLAATDWAAPTPESTLVLFDLAGGPPRALGAGLCPAFSPAGDRLAFLGYEAASRGLWVLDIAGGALRRVAEDRGETGLSEANAARRPAWSPDGGRLAYEGVGLPEGSGIFIVDLASGERRLVAPGLFGNLTWSADGRFLATSGAGPESGFAVIDLALGRVSRVPGEGSVGAYRASAHFRADGRVVFLADQTTTPRLVAFDPESLAAFPPLTIDVPVDASFWGLFEFVSDRRGGYLATVERYECDLYLADRTSP